ncbi:hypothetical protein QUF84_04130 [Fictibacillus enclensis]|uniref:hypothetical protein n=1 Tax=Fictibacillus enclensis TaxID=1017270 RepID=UPI0025A08F11|nr:hypothetical protein [Fictibacillus enclensis]MDM5336417.1 hypothetical protein [Fictibacillus enclensis]
MGRLVSHCEGIKHKLQWECQAVHGVYWELDHTNARSLYYCLIQKLEHYERPYRPGSGGCE